MDGGVVVLILILLLLAALCAFRCYRKRQQANATIYSRVDESSHGFDAEELAFKRCGPRRPSPALTQSHTNEPAYLAPCVWMLHTSASPRVSSPVGMVACLSLLPVSPSLSVALRRFLRLSSQLSPLALILTPTHT